MPLLCETDFLFYLLHCGGTQEDGEKHTCRYFVAKKNILKNTKYYTIWFFTYDILKT